MGGGVGGGVITSCEVRWMMLNPGRCCLVGRCCYVASFVVVYRRVGWGGGWGGCNNFMWSALDDVESWKMLLCWKMLLRCKFSHPWEMQNFPVSARRNVNFFRHENGTSIDQINSEKNIIHCKTQYKNNIFHPHAKKKVSESEDEKDAMFISSMVLQ